MSKSLEQFYGFFDKRGSERLDGMDSSVIQGLTPDERKEAFDFLVKRLSSGGTDEVIHLLYSVDPERAFTTTTALLGANRLTGDGETTAAAYAYKKTHDLKLLTYFTRNYKDKNEFVRRSAISQTPVDQPTRPLVAALSSVLFEEAEKFPRNRAIEKLLLMHGLADDLDPKSINAHYFRNLATADRTTRTSLLKELDEKYPIKYVG